MIEFLKRFLLFIVIGVTNFVLSIFYLSFTNLPGGETGMVPFFIIYYSLIGLTFSSVLYIIFKKIYNLTIPRSILLYQIIYIIILIFNETNPFKNRFEGFIQNLNLWIYLFSFLATITLLLLYKIYTKQKTP
jgi:hypothetical protein